MMRTDDTADDADAQTTDLTNAERGDIIDCDLVATHEDEDGPIHVVRHDGTYDNQQTALLTDGDRVAVARRLTLSAAMTRRERSWSICFVADDLCLDPGWDIPDDVLEDLTAQVLDGHFDVQHIDGSEITLYDPHGWDGLPGVDDRTQSFTLNGGA